MVVGLLSVTGCPSVDLGDTPSDITQCNPPGGVEYFRTVVWPEYIKPADTDKGCTTHQGASCHVEGGTTPQFRTSPIDFPFNYRLTQNFLNCGQPMASYLLTKPLAGIEGHGGKDVFMDGDPRVQIFLDWFE